MKLVIQLGGYNVIRKETLKHFCDRHGIKETIADATKDMEEYRPSAAKGWNYLICEDSEIDNEIAKLKWRNMVAPTLSSYIKSCMSNIIDLADGSAITPSALLTLLDKNGKFDVLSVAQRIESDLNTMESYKVALKIFMEMLTDIDAGDLTKFKADSQDQTKADIKLAWKHIKEKEALVLKALGVTDVMMALVDKYGDSSPTIARK